MKNQKCCVRGCDTTSLNTEGCSFFRIPKKSTRVKWIQFAQIPDNLYSDPRVCEKHFEQKCFRSFHPRTKLYPGSIPTIKNYANNSRNEYTSEESNSANECRKEKRSEEELAVSYFSKKLFTMHDLFVRPNGSPMQFHLADLNTEMKTKYTLLIEDSGGMVEDTANENVMTFTIPDKCMGYKFVFNVQFIDDCIEHKKILNVSDYYLGDKRFNKGCRTSRGLLRNSQCYCSNIKYDYICKVEQNEMSIRYATLKSTESKETKKPKNVPSKKNPTVELNIEKSKKLKQATLKPTVIEKKYDEEYLSRIIDETDSESEFIPLSLLTQTAGKNLRKSAHPENSKISQPSTSKDKSDTNSVVTVSSGDEEDENELPENSVKEPVPVLLQKFVDETRKDKKIDKYDHPESSSVYYREKFEEWETRAMLRYLLIIDQVDEAKDPAVWKRLVQLRVLPRKKGYKAMLNYFKRVILPNIETYNLPPEALAKFQALGHPRNIIDT